MIKQEIKWTIRYTAGFLRRQIGGWSRELSAWRRFWKSYHEYQSLAPIDKQALPEYLYPCLGDDLGETPIEPIYFYQDSWAFEKIVQQAPEAHVDVGSHHKFVALLSKVVPVTMVDIRPLSLPLDSLKFQQGSILDLPYESDSLQSLSSLCVVEHIGLGRYGDPLDPFGSEKAIEELKRVIAPGGYLYLSVPVGDQNIVAFNGGRIFALDYLLELVHPLQMVEQQFIVGNCLQSSYESRSMFGTTGLFILTKTEMDI
jgi:SAM-dependent methyltransferase